MGYYTKGLFRTRQLRLKITKTTDVPTISRNDVALRKSQNTAWLSFFFLDFQKHFLGGLSDLLTTLPRGLPLMYNIRRRVAEPTGMKTRRA